MRILILSRKFEIYSTSRLVEEIRNLSHSVLLWDPEWPVSRAPSSFEALIPRLGTFQFEQSLQSLAELATRTSLVLNTDSAYSRSRNKWHAYQAFLKKGVRTPYSELVTKNLSATIWSQNFPCIMKELESSKGEGVYLISNPQELATRVQGLSKECLLQEAFPETFGEDIRAFVVGDKIISSMKRRSKTDFRSNISLGGTAEPCSLSSSEEALILQATESLQLDIAGVDLLRTHKGSLILEANPCPGLEGIEKYTQINVARAIIKYIEEQYEKQSGKG